MKFLTETNFLFLSLMKTAKEWKKHIRCTTRWIAFKRQPRKSEADMESSKEGNILKAKMMWQLNNTFCTLKIKFLSSYDIIFHKQLQWFFYFILFELNLCFKNIVSLIQQRLLCSRMNFAGEITLTTRLKFKNTTKN